MRARLKQIQAHGGEGKSLNMFLRGYINISDTCSAYRAANEQWHSPSMREKCRELSNRREHLANLAASGERTLNCQRETL